MQTKVVGIDSNAMIDIFRIDIRLFGSQEAAERETSQIEVFWQNKVVFMDRHFDPWRHRSLFQIHNRSMILKIRASEAAVDSPLSSERLL